VELYDHRYDADESVNLSQDEKYHETLRELEDLLKEHYRNGLWKDLRVLPHCDLKRLTGNEEMVIGQIISFLKLNSSDKKRYHAR